VTRDDYEKLPPDTMFKGWKEIVPAVCAGLGWSACRNTVIGYAAAARENRLMVRCFYNRKGVFTTKALIEAFAIVERQGTPRGSVAVAIAPTLKRHRSATPAQEDQQHA